jgi:hypothetical protein
MKIYKASVLNLFFLLLMPFALQSQIAIGEWRDHLPYIRTIGVADAGPLVYCATPYSLFYLDKEESSVHRMTKVNGLSDIGVSTISYNETYETLLIAYSNANIDLIKGNTIVNISDIKRKPILGNKTINNIMFIDNYAYLACGFGIVVLDIVEEEFPEPIYYIGPEGSQLNVLDVAFGMDSLYAATETGIYKADINSPNLADYSSWSVDNRLYPNAYFNEIEFFNGDLVVNNENEGYGRDTTFLYDFTTHQWGYFPGANYFRKPSITTAYDQLLITSEGAVNIFNTSLEKIYNIYFPGDRYLNARDATIDSDNMKWIADYNLGLIKTPDGYSAEFIQPNGPFSASVFDMSLQGQSLWVAAGGHTGSWGKMYNSNGLYSFENESWKSYNKHVGVAAFDSISDMVCVAVDPSSPNRVYVGTWQSGVMEIVDGEISNIFIESNSSLEKWPAANYVAVSGVAFDNQNNLWVANSGAGSLISVKEPNGNWTSFQLGAGASGTDIGKMMVDSHGQKWVLMRADHSLLVFNDNNTISDPTDDNTKILSNVAGNGDLPGNKVLSFAQDLDGEVWLGTDEGIGIIYSPENIFTGGNFDAQRPLVEVGGYVQYLLESETVTAITVDGANKKWIGTERAGVFYLSADGTEEIHHFTEENSPMYSNSIIDIEINGETGEVFFGTDRGIISYKSIATPGGPTNSGVVAYPNPVREGYQGTIAIKGLVNNANVKITDVSGTLIFATRAEGGQAVWDGRSFNGSRAHTGVYLVFASDEKGEETIVTKILVIN